MIQELDDRYLLFLNTTKVFKARLPLDQVKILRKNGKEVWLDQGEIFVYSLLSPTQFECLVSDSKNFRPGAKVFRSDTIQLESIAFTDNGILFELHGAQVLDFLQQFGEMPLPPYIHYSKDKEAWYQTFFAEEIGSAAAPTASLHFTPELVQALEQKGIRIQHLCLHVGLGTFKPVFESDIRDQKLHFEPMLIDAQVRKMIADAKQAGKIFLPVGTTMVRYLESLPYIWRFLKKKNLISSIDVMTQCRRDKLTSEIKDDEIASYVPEQEMV